MSGAVHRSELAARQETLMRAVTGGGEAAGFDSEQVRRFGASLQAKRERTVARAWPALTGSLGSRYTGLFAEFAAAHALPPGGPVADGRGFARWLSRRENLGEEAEREVALFDLRCRLTPSGELRERGWACVPTRRNGRRILLVRLAGREVRIGPIRG